MDVFVIKGHKVGVRSVSSVNTETYLSSKFAHRYHLLCNLWQQYTHNGYMQYILFWQYTHRGYMQDIIRDVMKQYFLPLQGLMDG